MVEFSHTLAWHARLSVAPMMAWTDRHCRVFHRKLSRHALLYTEMVTAAALVHGGALHLLDHSPEEHPVALQLGGSDAAALGQAARMGADAGYPEVNLNVGCPSDRVQSGAFGAVLMTMPQIVFDAVRTMQDACDAEITVKCRIGVDDQNPAEVLPEFLRGIAAAGVQRVTIHARKAWLSGLSPKENRDIPPLDYPLVQQMKAEFPGLHISINGGIADLPLTGRLLESGLDGVMIGRAAYHTPAQVLANADAEIFASGVPSDIFAAAYEMGPYIDAHLASGGRLHQITRHMLGLFSGLPGARQWRRTLSELGADHSATRRDFETALQAVSQAQKAANDWAEGA